MNRVWLLGSLLLGLGVGAPFAVPLAAAQVPTTSPTATPADAGEQKKRLIEQKIKLLESLLNSPAARNAAYGTEAQTTTLVEYGQRTIAAARQSAAEGKYDEASKLLDEAMRATGKATRRLQSEGALADSAQRKTYDDQSEQIATYRASLVDLTRDPKIGDSARQLLTKIDGLSGEAKQLAAAARLGEANKKLAEAYKLATEEIARLRQGHEVVMSLKFDTPAEEFAYEQKRYSSNQIMVDMMITEGKAEGERRKMIDQFLGDARRQKDEADSMARSGNYKEAVKAMEKAGGQLVRALQMMGVPVF